MRPDQGKIVFIVDDEEQVRKLSRLILKKAGYRVLMASSSQEALVISRGYSEQIDLLLSDIEMPGLNGIALGHQITAERPGIAVLLNSANPFYAEETQFAFLAKPFSPEQLQVAVAQTLGSQPQAVAHGELEAFQSLVIEDSCPLPEISIPEMPRIAAGARLLRETLSHTLEDQAGRDSATVLPELDRGLPEVVVLIREDGRNSSKINWWTMRTAARNLAIGVRAHISRWRLAHAVPAWTPVAAPLALALVLFSLYQITEKPSARLYTVSLQGVRGIADTAEAPAGEPLLLSLDVTTLQRFDSYEIQILNEEGHSLWKKTVPAHGSEVRVNAAPHRPGTYFLRVYGPGGDLLKEYVLRVAETH